MRRFAVSAGLLLAACACLGVVPVPALAAAPTLAVTPDRGVLPTSPGIRGSCPAVDTPDGPAFPAETVLTLDRSGSGPWKVPLAADGTFTGFVADLNAGAPPGSYAFATSCGGSAPFVVLGAPTLRLVPVQARQGATVAVTGSCPRRPRGATPAPDVLLDGRLLGTAPLDALTGQFGPLSLEVPNRAAPGPHQLSTSCGGQATLTVLPPVVTPPPGAALVVVPDLRGRTERQAIAALAGRLVLTGGTGGSGRIRSQDPLPGTRVRPGSAVQVVLEVSIQPPSTGPALLPVAAVVVTLLLVLVAAAVGTARVLRRRERRWLDQHLAVGSGRSYLQLSDVPYGDVPGLDVQLVVRRDDAPRFADQGVSHAGR